MPSNFVFDPEAEEAANDQMVHNKKLSLVLKYDAQRYNLFCDFNAIYMSKSQDEEFRRDLN